MAKTHWLIGSQLLYTLYAFIGRPPHSHSPFLSSRFSHFFPVSVCFCFVSYRHSSNLTGRLCFCVHFDAATDSGVCAFSLLSSSFLLITSRVLSAEFIQLHFLLCFLLSFLWFLFQVCISAQVIISGVGSDIIRGLCFKLISCTISCFPVVIAGLWPCSWLCFQVFSQFFFHFILFYCVKVSVIFALAFWN